MQKSSQYGKAIILQLKINKFQKKSHLDAKMQAPYPLSNSLAWSIMPSSLPPSTHFSDRIYHTSIIVTMSVFAAQL